MSEPDRPDLASETDPRFPSGPWTGFFLQKETPGRHAMELRLRFADGVLTGEGRDRIGTFLVRGKYNTDDGRCHFTKKYVGRHDVFYDGFNEGKGIWGTWEIPPTWHGGFHIWPEGMPDPTEDYLAAAATPPAEDPVAPPPLPEVPGAAPAEEEAIPAGASEASV